LIKTRREKAMSINTTVKNKEPAPSHLLEYLPATFRDDPLMGRFLLIFESILDPIENTVDNLALYFDPRLTPESLLPWLASWIDLTLDPSWPLERRRELVQNAADLYRWRGTKHGLSEYMRSYTGAPPVILEFIPGMILDEKTQLGVNTVLGSSGTGHHFSVIIETNDESNIDPKTVREIIESQKPAYTVYTLEIRNKTS
jgi:phage tail-like protein